MCQFFGELANSAGVSTIMSFFSSSTRAIQAASPWCWMVTTVYVKIPQLLFHTQVLAMRRILLLTPDQVPDPRMLVRCQDSIRAGFPAYILHPMIDKDTYEKIATCTFAYMQFPAHPADSDQRRQATRPLNEMDHLRALRRLPNIDEAHVAQCLENRSVSLSDNRAACWKTLAGCPMTGYILQRCKSAKFCQFPIPTSYLYKMNGRGFRCLYYCTHHAISTHRVHRHVQRVRNSAPTTCLDR